MRPVKMTMSAFGPYAAETVVDFDALGTAGVYLVCGDTGAGKTMIFDAVSFALFGQASGDGKGARDASSLRSDYAESDAKTFVELEFEYRGQRYVVKRNPKYERRKKRGEGTTSELAGAELTLPDGSVVSGATNVTARIEELLGIDAAQFKQIVMLAQGEFRKLLTADTAEREVIFRKLFKTERYDLLSRLLASELDKIEKKNDAAKREISSEANRVSFPEGSEQALLLEEYRSDTAQLGPWLVETLETFVEEQAPVCDELQKRVDDLRGQWHELNVQRNQALGRPEAERECKELEDGIRELEEAAPALVEAFQEQVRKDGQRTKLSEDAAVIEGTFAKYQELETVEAEKEKAQRQAVEAAAAVEHATQEHERVQAEMNGLSTAMNALEGADVRLAQAEAESQSAVQALEAAERVRTQAQNLAAGEEAVRSAEQALHAAREALDVALAQKQAAQEKLELVLGKRAELEGADIAAAEAKAASEKAKAACADAEGLVTQRTSLAADAEGAVEPYERKRSEYQQAETVHMEDQRFVQELQMRQRAGRAGLLAADLQEGLPCPVCGSTHHPQPAQASESIPADEEIDAAVEREAASKQKATSLSLEAERLGAVLQQKQEALVSFEREHGGLQALEEGVQNARKHAERAERNLADALERKDGYDAANRAVQLEQKAAEKAARVADEAKSAHQKANEVAVAANAQVETMREALGALDVAAAESERQRAAERRADAERKLQEARAQADERARLAEQLKAADNKLGQAVTVLGSAQEASRKCSEALKLKTGQLENLRKDLEFASLAAARQQAQRLRSEAQTMLEAREAARKAVDENATAITSDKSSLAEKKKRLEDIPKLDVKDAERRLNGLQEQGERARAEADAARIRLDTNRTCLESLRATLGKIGDIAERYGRIKQLSDAANGMLVGQKKLKFEPYVQGIYFDRVIRAANKRLKLLTSGQFELQRNVEGSGNAKTGLGLKVIDNYTGRSRDASSLSGGESFEASLCLALGLSDVVQANSGGVEFDTMFVDEGFGSLDQAALGNAITLLSDLSGGDKLIGIISHVEELKANIPKKVVVKKDRTGSHIAMDV